MGFWAGVVENLMSAEALGSAEESSGGDVNPNF